MFIKETVKGMRDILPAEMEIREYLLGKLKYLYTSFGYTQIETPCMERIENLTSKQGGAKAQADAQEGAKDAFFHVGVPPWGIFQIWVYWGDKPKFES